MNILTMSFLFLITTGCASKHVGNFTLPSESPCIDGTIMNIDSRGCKVFFWGVRKETVKIRCTMTDDQNWWVNTSFYVMPKSSEDHVSEHWSSFCSDRNFNVYTGPTLLRVGAEMNVEASGMDFRGSHHAFEKGTIVEVD